MSVDDALNSIHDAEKLSLGVTAQVPQHANERSPQYYECLLTLAISL